MDGLRVKFFITSFLALFVLALLLLLPGGDKNSPDTPVSDQKISPVPQAQVPNPSEDDGKVITDVKKFETKLNEVLGPVTNPFKPLASTTPQKLPHMSDAELFRALFPQYYLDGLTKIQDNFVGIQWLNPEDQVTMDSEKNVLTFLNNSVEILVSKGFYPGEERAYAARRAVRVNYPAVLQKKKEALEREHATYWLGGVTRNAFTQANEKNLGSFLTYVFPFFTETAQAQLNIDGIWVTSPDCYKAIARGYQASSALFSFCCNCGIKFYGYIPVYVEDCGPFAGSNGNGALCDVHLGCLNNTCSGYYQAVWDGPGKANPMYSFTCECDDPQHAQ